MEILYFLSKPLPDPCAGCGTLLCAECARHGLTAQHFRPDGICPNGHQLEEAELVTVRKSPCPSCPYRRDVPSGVWHPEEYALLASYDGDMLSQAQTGAFGLFFCHQADGNLCAGWAGCHDMTETLAARISSRDLDPSVFEYESPVPLFASGAEAAVHGMRDTENPGAEAQAMIHKIVRVRALRGRPVR